MNIKFKSFYIIAAGCLILLANQASAQTAPEFLVSWKTASFVPPGYHGKIFPTSNTPVEISFDVIDNNKITDLSKNEVRWELDDKLLVSGVGLKTANFNSKSREQAVRITVINYKDQNLEKTIVIPSFRPEIIIENKLLNKKIKLGEYNFNALPYFFNVTNPGELSFSWKINGNQIASASDNPESLNLNLGSQTIPANTDIVLSAVVKNFFNEFESATKKIYLVVAP